MQGEGPECHDLMAGSIGLDVLPGTSSFKLFTVVHHSLVLH